MSFILFLPNLKKKKKISIFSATKQKWKKKKEELNKKKSSKLVVNKTKADHQNSEYLDRKQKKIGSRPTSEALIHTRKTNEPRADPNILRNKTQKSKHPILKFLNLLRFSSFPLLLRTSSPGVELAVPQHSHTFVPSINYLSFSLLEPQPQLLKLFASSLNQKHLVAVSCEMCVDFPFSHAPPLPHFPIHFLLSFFFLFIIIRIISPPLIKLFKKKFHLNQITSLPIIV